MQQKILYLSTYSSCGRFIIVLLKEIRLKPKKDPNQKFWFREPFEKKNHLNAAFDCF